MMGMFKKGKGMNKSFIVMGILVIEKWMGKKKSDGNFNRREVMGKEGTRLSRDGRERKLMKRECIY